LITATHLNEVAEGYAEAWDELLTASPKSSEYPMEAHAAHLLASAMKRTTESGARAPILEAYYWRPKDGRTDRGKRYGRADLWVPPAEGTKEGFVEVKLAGFGENRGRIGRKDAREILATFAKDVERLSRYALRPKPTSAVQCALMVVAHGKLGEASDEFTTATLTDDEEFSGAADKVSGFLNGLVGRAPGTDSKQLLATFLRVGRDVATKLGVEGSARLISGARTQLPLHPDRSVQALALVWEQSEL